MPYCDDTDVRRYIPQAPAGEDFSGYIDDAQGIIDAQFRGIYETPLWAGVLLDVDLFVRSIAARLAAGTYLVAAMSQHQQEPSAYSQRLMSEARADLDSIKDDPAMLDADLVEEGVIDDDKLDVILDGEDEEPVFNMETEDYWG